MHQSVLIPSSLSPVLAELDRQFTAAAAEASALLDGLQESQFNWRPDSQNWSMAECLQHLNVVGERCVRLIETSLADARRLGRVAEGPFGYGWLGKWILDHTEPPSRLKFRAPRAFVPAQGQPITAVLSSFQDLQDRLSRLLEQASGLDLAHIKVRAPEAPMFRFNLQFVFAWIAAHERRHLWQAKQVRNHAAFPAVVEAGTSVPTAWSTGWTPSNRRDRTAPVLNRRSPAVTECVPAVVRR